MSRDGPPRVLIHILGSAGSGRSTFKRRFLLDIFSDAWDASDDLEPYHKQFVTSSRHPVLVTVQTSIIEVYHSGVLVDSFIRPADGLIVIMTPARPSVMDETVRLRLEVLNAAIKANAGLIERVVILKDTEVPWGIDAEEYSRHPDLERHDVDNQDRERREAEWEEGAARGYDLAKRLGAEVSIACPRTGAGVNEAFNDLVLEILERRGILVEKEPTWIKRQKKPHTLWFKRLLENLNKGS